MDSLEALVQDLRTWGAADPNIIGIAIVGSRARGTAKRESDIDVVVVAAQPSQYFSQTDWMRQFGILGHSADEDWGLVRSRRVQYTDGKEIEFEFADERWTRVSPVDPGTSEVVRNGLRVVYDPKRLLRLVSIAAEPEAPQRDTIKSSCGRYERDVWLLPGPSDQSHPLCVFLDGEFYLHDVKCLPVLRNAWRNRELAPMCCLFVSYAGTNARHEDYAWNPHYGEFIAEDARAWAAQHAANISERNNVICGLSLSGLAAAHIAMDHPNVFSRALCQSGSFWWLMDHPTRLRQTRGRFWLSVGSEETERGVCHPPTGLFQRVSQIEGVEYAVRAFEACGARVHHHVYSGGHVFAEWTNELIPSLNWLLGD
jgi:enterochelin esterase-like enzyme/predicted nucleotidyltransferase